MSRIAIAFFLLLPTHGLWALEKPFWEKSPNKLAEKIKDRKIPVSVKSVQLTDKKHHLRLQGIGEVSAPFFYAKKWTANFIHLNRVSTYVRDVKWNPISRRLFLHTEAFSFHAYMQLKISLKDSKGARDLHFEVVEGVFKGMKGSLKVHEHKFTKSYVSIDASYYYQEWTIPKLFLEFGLEVVLQKFAERLRALIEEDFKKGKLPEVEKTK